MSDSVGVNFTAELDGSQQSLAHVSFIGVRGHIDLVVADVRLWQGRVVPTHTGHGVLVRLACDVQWHLGATCHELQVQLLVGLRELRENLPKYFLIGFVTNLLVF
jgi:hypothetical protein